MRSTFILRFLLVPVLSGASLLSQSQASLLVYEGFVGYSGNLGSATPNSNTIGLNQSVAYTGAGVANYTVNASSLSFGSNFLTNGGSVTTTSGTSVAAATMALGSSYVGTLYGSYLVQLTSKGSAAGDGALARIANTAANVGERFESFADSRSSSTNIGAAYDSTAAVGSTGLATGTTYLMLSCFTNVGSALSGGAGSGIATVYALTLAQYESFLAAGATQSYLDSAAVGTGSSEITGRVSDTVTSGTYSFSTGNFAQFVSVADVAQFDEMRYGTTLADVIPVPEPSTFVLAAAGLGALYVLRRRSQS